MVNRLPSLHTSESEYIAIRARHGLYIDKTHHFASLLSPDNKYVFLARPRRFGKTLLLSTLEAYFQGSLSPVSPMPSVPCSPGALFANTAVQDIAPLHPMHPVIRLNMSHAGADDATQMIRNLLTHLEQVYTQWYRRGVNTGLEPRDPALGQITFGSDMAPAPCLARLIDCLYQHYGQAPVVLIDEYDAPITRLIGTDISPAPFLRALRDFYATLKHSESSLHFVFITGVSRFAHVNLFSALNNLRDITWNRRYATLCGFTEQEMQIHLRPYLEVGASHLGWQPDDLQDALRDHYNGYRFSRHYAGENVYNPFSLTSCLQGMQDSWEAQEWHQYGWPNFWAESGTPDFLIRLVEQGCYTLSPEPPPLHTLSPITYNLDNPNYTSLMLQTGYYTLRGGGPTPLHVAYPNKEVSLTYAESLLELYIHRLPDYHVLRDLHTALREETYDLFCGRLTTFMADIPGEKLTRETDYHLVLHALCKMMEVKFQSEAHEWGGRPDLVIQFPEHVCVMELKHNQSASQALLQIENNIYGRSHHGGPRRVVGLGLNFVKSQDNGATRIEHAVAELYRPQAEKPART